MRRGAVSVADSLVLYTSRARGGHRTGVQLLNSKTMNNVWKVGILIAKSTVVGLAVAFLAVLARPELINRQSRAGIDQSYADAVAASAPAVANVFTERAVSGGGALGSAVVINAEGYMVTNWHVVRDAAQIQVQLADGRVTTPILVGADPDTELALLKIDLPDLPSVRLGRSDSLRVGDVVFAIGNSLGFSQTVTMGIVSATGRGLGVTTFEDFIQTDAAINVGNSGGALINADGELVGINTAVVSSGTTATSPPEGIGFAIPVNLVRGVMADIIAHGRVIRGYLGVISVAEVSMAEARTLGLDGPAIRVLSVDGPASAAGLVPGDVLTHIEGQRIYTRQQARNLIASSEPGERIRIGAVRANGAPLEIEAVLGERPSGAGS